MTLDTANGITVPANIGSILVDKVNINPETENGGVTEVSVNTLHNYTNAR